MECGASQKVNSTVQTPYRVAYTNNNLAEEWKFKSDFFLSIN